MPDLEDYISTDEAAEKLRFHVEHVRHMLRGGNIDGIKVGRTWLVSRSSVEKYIEKTQGMNKRDPRRGTW